MMHSYHLMRGTCPAVGLPQKTQGVLTTVGFGTIKFSSGSCGAIELDSRIPAQSTLSIYALVTSLRWGVGFNASPDRVSGQQSPDVSLTSGFPLREYSESCPLVGSSSGYSSSYPLMGS